MHMHQRSRTKSAVEKQIRIGRALPRYLAETCESARPDRMCHVWRTCLPLPLAVTKLVSKGPPQTMNSLTGFDDHEDFFGSYDAEEGGMSLAPLGFDEAEAQPPTSEQLAHSARFRRPVALVVSGMALLSIVALGKHGFQQLGSQRELVAHYGSALAASPLATTATVKHTALVPEASPSLVPEAWSALFAEAWSTLVPDASAADASAPVLAARAAALALEPAPALAPLSERSTQSDSSLVSAFVSSPALICLLPEAERVADAAGARPALAPNRRIFLPATPAPASSALLAAPAPPNPFNSIARFPDLQR